MEGYEDAVAWLCRQGVEMTERLTGLFGTGVGRRVGDMPRAVELLRTRLEQAGGRIVCGARATELECDGNGRVAGVAATTADGTLRVPAGAVILCTGGFQADRDLVAEHIGADPDNLVVRAAPHSTGDGLRLALSAGAALSEGMDAFYGHLMPAPPARVPPERILFLTQYYSHHCVLLNREGRRFVDESAADEVSTQALARQPGSEGFLVLDAVAAEHVGDPVAAGFPPVDRHAELQAAGGRVYPAEDLDGLERVLEEAGADGGHVFFEHYAGGLALSLVFGRRAGAYAATHVATAAAENPGGAARVAPC